MFVFDNSIIDSLACNDLDFLIDIRIFVNQIVPKVSKQVEGVRTHDPSPTVIHHGQTSRLCCRVWCIRPGERSSDGDTGVETREPVLVTPSPRQHWHWSHPYDQLSIFIRTGVLVMGIWTFVNKIYKSNYYVGGQQWLRHCHVQPWQWHRCWVSISIKNICLISSIIFTAK